MVDKSELRRQSELSISYSHPALPTHRHLREKRAHNAGRDGSGEVTEEAIGIAVFEPIAVLIDRPSVLAALLTVRHPAELRGRPFQAAFPHFWFVQWRWRNAGQRRPPDVLMHTGCASKRR